VRCPRGATERPGWSPNEPLDYGTDPATWRRAFHEHFPALQLALDRASEADAAFVKLKERLQDEVHTAGMDAPPWTPEKFLPWLATTIQARALQPCSTRCRSRAAICGSRSPCAWGTGVARKSAILFADSDSWVRSMLRCWNGAATRAQA